MRSSKLAVPALAFGRTIVVWVCSVFIGSGVVYSCRKEAREGSRPIARVAILQAEPQEWADALKLGFVAGLEAAGMNQGRDVMIVLRSATGGGTNLDVLARLLAESHDSAAVYTLGTQASQAYFGAMRDGSAPMVFGAVTDPVSAGFYEGSLSRPRKNLTGSQDIWPYERQFELVHALLGDGKSVGMVYNPSEANTAAALGLIRAAATKARVGLVERAVETAQQIEAAVIVVSKSKGVAALYIGPDNLTQANSATLLALGEKLKLPVFTGISGIVEKGAAGTVGTNYFEVGKVNGQQMATLLRGATASSIAPAVAQEGDLYLNLTVLNRLGINVPAELRAKTVKVY